MASYLVVEEREEKEYLVLHCSCMALIVVRYKLVTLFYINTVSVLVSCHVTNNLEISFAKASKSHEESGWLFQHCCGVDGLLPQQWTLISNCHPCLTVTTELL